MVNLDKISFTTHLFLDVEIKYIFSQKFTVYTTDGEDLPKGHP